MIFSRAVATVALGVVGDGVKAVVAAAVAHVVVVSAVEANSSLRRSAGTRLRKQL